MSKPLRYLGGLDRADAQEKKKALATRLLKVGGKPTLASSVRTNDVSPAPTKRSECENPATGVSADLKALGFRLQRVETREQVAIHEGVERLAAIFVQAAKTKTAQNVLLWPGSLKSLAVAHAVATLALAQTLKGDWGLQETGDTFQRMAASAGRRFLVMTPFLDADGLDRVLSLFEMTRPGVARYLVVRDAEATTITAVKQLLTELNVSVFEFRLAKGAGQHETFHAKVVVADNDQCYVGSSNMTTWSFNYSLELGFHVQGESAKRTAEIVDAVLAVSLRKM